MKRNIAAVAACLLVSVSLLAQVRQEKAAVWVNPESGTIYFTAVPGKYTLTR